VPARLQPARCPEADIPEVARSLPKPTRASTAHHVRTGENRQIGEQQFEEARLCRFSPSLFRAVRYWSSVSFSCCRLLELPEMAYRHPLLKPFYGGLQGRFPCFAPISSHSPQKPSNIRAIYLCWLLGTSVLKIDNFALDLLIFLGAVACTDEGMQAHCVCLHPSCRRMRCSSSPSVRDERAEVSFRHFKNTMVCGTQSLQVLQLVS
jgi:hypothetical protein